MNALLERLRLAACWIGMLSDHIILLRIPLILVAAGAFLTFRVDQISEFFFLLGKGGEQPLQDAFGALIVTFAFGLAVWYSARVLYRFEFAARPALASAQFAGFRKWCPRILGAAVPALMAIGCILQIWAASHSVDHDDRVRLVVYSASYVAEAVVILVFVAKRRTLVRAFEARRKVAASSRMEADPGEDAKLTSLAQLGAGFRIFQVTLLLNVLAFICAWLWPSTLAGIGTLALIQLTALFFTVTGTWALTYTERCAVPIVTLFVVLAFCFQLLSSNDNHHVRQSTDQASWQARTPVISNLEDGRAVLGRKLDGIKDGPVFLVSAEGGGIRAAAWTALVLARLDAETNGAFGDRLIAASGVSGGSLGIATYAAMRRLRLEKILTPADFACGAKQAANADRCPAREFLTRDFLRPVLANMLIIDATQRWLPWAILPDRGTTLERAWERNWSQTIRSLSPTNAFASAWRAGVATNDDPWLLFNTTIVSSGQRMIEQPYAFAPGTFDEFFPGAVNGALRLDASAPLSAVVHNSARFTYVSPAGLLDPPKSDPPSTPLQVVDGGYFENSGTATLLGVYRMLTAKGGLETPIAASRIRVIHISNDPNVPAMLADLRDGCANTAKGSAGEHAPEGAPHTGEIASPVVALLNTREARGELSREAIVREAIMQEARDNVMHFRLCTGEHHLPLGWTLSDAAWTELARQVGDGHLQGDTPNIALNVVQTKVIRDLLKN